MQNLADPSSTNLNKGLEYYDLTTVWFHWATTILVVILWSIAQVSSFVPRGAALHNLWSAHIPLGAVLFLVIVGRIYWRARRGRILPSGSRLHGWIGKMTHWILYALLVGTIVLGVGNEWARGWDLFGLVGIPQYDPADTKTSLAHAINGWHDIVANSMRAIASLHALTALFHHYVLRNDVLRRMVAVR